MCLWSMATMKELYFTRQLNFIGNLALEERIRLTQIADKCSVHKTLSGQIIIIPGKVQ